MTLPPINYLPGAPRYTTVAAVKKRLNIDAADTEWDQEITAAIVAVELGIDKYLGAPFPRPDWEPAINGVPTDVSQAAEHGSIALFNAMDAPFGVQGSDDYVGEVTINIGEVVAAEVRRNPLLNDYRVSFGIGG